ncbi:phosphonate ABC transporter substrate-binding protein [Thermocrinis sp.]
MKKLVLMLLSFISVLSVVQAREKCLVMGLIPAEDPKTMVQQYTPMKNWMEKEMGRCIEMFTATDYTGVIEAMRAKKVDFAWFGGFSYILAAERANAEAFAVGVDARGKHTYRSILVATPEAAQALGITRPLEGDEGMKVLKERLERHRDKFTFAFTDPASTSGYAIPMYFFVKNGIEPDKYFKKVSYAGTHDAAQLAVANKTIDIVADNEVTHERLLSSGKIKESTNVVIWRSPEIPGPPMAYRKDLPADVKEALKRTITKVPRDVVTGFGKVTAYTLVSDADYALIREVKRFLDAHKK